MKEKELRQALDEAISTCQLSEYRKRQILAQMKGEDEPVKKKLSVSLAVVIAVMIMTLGAAVALIHSNIADNLYPDGSPAPEAVLEQIQTPQETTETPLGSLTLDELLYDGHSLHTSITLQNPTAETLLYTVDSLTLGGSPLERIGGNLLMEGAGSAGVLLGGTVDGTAMPESRSLYNEATQIYRLEDSGKFLGTVDLPAGENTLHIEVAVWRPLSAPKLVNYQDYEGVDAPGGISHLVTDQTGYCNLWLFRPEDAYRAYSAGQSGAEAYQEVFRELGWAELVDKLILDVPVVLNSQGMPKAAPDQTVYTLDGCTLTLTHFDLTHTGGRLEGDLSGDPKGVRQLMQGEGLHLVDREGCRILNNGSWWTEPDANGTIHLTMMLNPVTGELPKQVWLAPVLEMNSLWDPMFAGPNYDPEAPVPEDAISIYRLDYDRGVCMTLTAE